MSLQVWCYECDEYVEGWDLIEQVRGELDELDEELDIDGTDNTDVNHLRSIYKTKGSGTGKS